MEFRDAQGSNPTSAARILACGEFTLPRSAEPSYEKVVGVLPLWPQSPRDTTFVEPKLQVENSRGPKTSAPVQRTLTAVPESEKDEEEAFRVFEDDDDDDDGIDDATGVSKTEPAGDATENLDESDLVEQSAEATGSCVPPRVDEFVAVVTSTGRVLVVGRTRSPVGDDFTLVASLQLPHAHSGDRGDRGAGDGVGSGVVSNSLAVDERGGIYVVASTHMHKVVWTQSSEVERVNGASAGKLTLAWTSRYRE